MKKIWVHKTNSFKEAQEFDDQYYLRLTSAKRLEIVQYLRELYFKLNNRLYNESRKRLRRTIKIIKQT
jgi:hypothetical protein